MAASPAAVAAVQATIWNGSLPLEIRLAGADCRTFDDSEPYLVHHPRLSYLAFLVPRLHRHFAPSIIDPEVHAHDAWLSFQGVPLKWHLPLGLLYDLSAGAEPFSPDTAALPATSADALPWKLTVHYSALPAAHIPSLDERDLLVKDAFINAVKEADFVRNGTARTVMALSKEDSDNLWRSVRHHDLALFNAVNKKLLNPPGVELRHVPMKVYLPTSGGRHPTDTVKEVVEEEEEEEEPSAGQPRVVQSLVPLTLPSQQPQTLGTALNSLLPTLFPSRRNPIYARAVLHGAAVPLSARVDEMGRAAAYADGFLHISVVMHG